MYDIACPNIFKRYVNSFAITQNPCRLCLQADQSADSRTGAPLGARFQKTPDQDQRNDDRGGFEIDIHRTFGQHSREKGCNDREAPGRERTDHDERIHVGRAAQ